MISIMDIIMILVAINVQNNWSDFVALDPTFFPFVGKLAFIQHKKRRIDVR